MINLSGQGLLNYIRLNPGRKYYLEAASLCHCKRECLQPASSKLILFKHPETYKFKLITKHRPYKKYSGLDFIIVGGYIIVFRQLDFIIVAVIPNVKSTLGSPQPMKGLGFRGRGAGRVQSLEASDFGLAVSGA